MKSVVFKSLKGWNFLSFGETPIEIIFSPGITAISGENRDKGGKNGVGKSSIPSLLNWVIFGNTLSDLKKDQIIHDGAQSPCAGEFYFDVIERNQKDEYRIYRQMDPNSITLTKNGEDITLSSMPKTDALIQSIIGANEEVFRNAILMSANNTLPFMAQGKTAKRKFVEGVLRLGVFGEMLLKVRLDYNDEKRDNDIVSTRFIEKNKNLVLYQTQLAKNKEQKRVKIEELKGKLDENQKIIENLTKEGSVDTKKVELAKEISNIEAKLAKLEEKSQKDNSNFQEILKNEHVKRLDLQRKQEERLNHAKKTGTCPTCNRDYSAEEEREHLKRHLEELDIQIQNLQKEYNEIKKQKDQQEQIVNLNNAGILKLRDQAKTAFEQQSSLAVSSEKIQQLEETNQSLLLNIESISKERDSMEDLIQTTEKERKETELTLKDIQKQLGILETAKFVVSEEGVKTYIIKKMLGLLNSRLNFYLQALEAPCRCEFNEVFEETLINDQGKAKSYFNFSGGEKLRIDMAILFMFQDILKIQSTCSYSLSFYDELFDSALDEKGAGKILDILRSRVDQYNEAIYIISHNKNTMANIDQTILLEKSNGVTRIIQQ